MDANNNLLVGTHDSLEAAQKARADLIQAGFAPDQIKITGGGQDTKAATHAEEKGAIARFFDDLFGADGDERHVYDEAVRRGAYLVTVETRSAKDADTAQAVLNRSGAFDVDQRAKTWQGWSAGNAAAGTAGAARQTAAASADGATRKLQEVKEELQVGKRQADLGAVRVYNRVTEVPVSEDVRLRDERVDVQRRPVDRPATQADLAAFKEGSIELRETTEVPVVSKTARVTGEVEVGKTTTERVETVTDTVRESKVEVERVAADRGTPDAKR